MKRYKKKLKLKKSIQFTIFQVGIIAIIYILTYFTIRDASTSYTNYCHNAIMFLISFIASWLVLCLEDFIK
jgi:hypothetical protein